MPESSTTTVTPVPSTPCEPQRLPSMTAFHARVALTTLVDSSMR
jgi:hypothetical protein